MRKTWGIQQIYMGLMVIDKQKSNLTTYTILGGLIAYMWKEEQKLLEEI